MKARNAPFFDLRSELYRITGSNWAQVDRHRCLDGAKPVIAEAGTDLNALSSEKQFRELVGDCAPTNEAKRRQVLIREPESHQSSHRGVSECGHDICCAETKAIWARNTAACEPLGAPKAITGHGLAS